MILGKANWESTQFWVDWEEGTVSPIHAVSVYKKRLYKKRPVEFLLDKKRRLVDLYQSKKRVSYPYSQNLLI